MLTSLTLAAPLEEFHQYRIIFSNEVERLVSRVVVHEKAQELEKECGKY